MNCINTCNFAYLRTRLVLDDFHSIILYFVDFIRLVLTYCEPFFQLFIYHSVSHRLSRRHTNSTKQAKPLFSFTRKYLFFCYNTSFLFSCGTSSVSWVQKKKKNQFYNYSCYKIRRWSSFLQCRQKNQNYIT